MMYWLQAEYCDPAVFAHLEKMEGKARWNCGNNVSDVSAQPDFRTYRINYNLLITESFSRMVPLPDTSYEIN